jgi:hypothetical protein
MEAFTPRNVAKFVVKTVVAGKLKPITDNMIDKTADWIVAKREARKTQKETAE